MALITSRLRTVERSGWVGRLKSLGATRTPSLNKASYIYNGKGLGSRLGLGINPGARSFFFQSRGRMDGQRWCSRGAEAKRIMQASREPRKTEGDSPHGGSAWRSTSWINPGGVGFGVDGTRVRVLENAADFGLEQQRIISKSPSSSCLARKKSGCMHSRILLRDRRTKRKERGEGMSTELQGVVGFG